MHKKTLELSVGLLFLCAILAFAILALKVSGLGQSFKLDDGYTITAEFENIGGLKPRARVTIAGVAVGRVTAIRFDPKDYLAEVVIKMDEAVNNIPDDSRASILTSGLLGDNYIALTPGFSEQYFKAGDHITVENTNKAIVLEELVSKFVANKASDYSEDDLKPTQMSDNPELP